MLAGQVPFNILGRVGRAEPDLSAFDPEAIYARAFADPRAIHASCEDSALPARLILSMIAPIGDARLIRRFSLCGQDV